MTANTAGFGFSWWWILWAIIIFFFLWLLFRGFARRRTEEYVYDYDGYGYQCPY